MNDNFERNMEVIERRFPYNIGEQKFLIKTSDELKLTEPTERDHEWLTAVQGAVGKFKSIFVYGFSQGLGLCDLLEIYPDRIFFVYEPDEDSFINAINNIDLSLVLEHPNLYALTIGESRLKEMFSIMSMHIADEMAFVASRYNLGQNIDVLHQVKNDYVEYKKIYESNQNVRNLFRHDWIRNSLFQIPKMLKLPVINQIVGKAWGKTAVVVSSGPSLQKDIHWIEKLQKHAIIIAAGSSIQALAKHNIVPHLTVIMDGGDINQSIFSSDTAHKSPILFTSTAYYGVSDSKNDGLMYGVLSSDEVTSHFMGVSSNDRILHPNPTVAGTAIQTAIWLGCSRVLLMGQDLSFPGEQFYAEGINHGDQNHLKNMVNHAGHQVINVHGQYNRTTAGFLQMKDSIERIIRLRPETEFINTTRDGAKIEGTTWQSIEETYQIIKNESVEERFIANLINEAKNSLDNTSRVTFVRSRLFQTQEEISKLDGEVTELLKMIGKIREWSRTKPAKCQKTLESIEQAWASIVNKAWFNPLYETLIPVQIGEFDRKLPDIITEKSISIKSDMIAEHLGKLLKQVREQIPFLSATIGESIRRMEDSQLEEKLNV